MNAEQAAKAISFMEWERQEETGQFVSNDDLAMLILPWAVKAHPEAYKKTLTVAGIEKTFRAYLLRLIELRVEAEPEWIREVRLSVLDETSITQPMRLPDGTTIVVQGMKAPGPRAFAFWELALSPEDFTLLLAAKRGLDLTYAG